MITALTNHLWQSTLFAVAAGLLTLAFRKNRAQVRYWLWFTASLKFFVPLALMMSLGSRLEWRPAQNAIASPEVELAIEQVAQPFPETVTFTRPQHGNRDWIPETFLAVWACGFAWIAVIRWRGWLRVRAAVRASAPMEIPSSVAVRATPGLLEPGVVGCWRPILLLPEGIVERLTSSQLEAVLAHELCHVKRRDNLTSAIHMMVEAMFWFHPLVWWLGARLVEERERACDEGVVSLGSEPHVYAEAILNVCKLYMESPLACMAGVTGADLKKRIEAIITNRVVLRLNLAKKVSLALAGIAAIAVPIAIGMMSEKAMRAQSPPVAIAPPVETPPPQVVTPKFMTQVVIHQAPAGPAVASPQVVPPKPAFEVASIRVCEPGENPGGRGARGGKASDGSGPSPNRLTTGCQPLIVFMRQAYVSFAGGRSNENLYTEVEGGPAWVRSERYQINAKAEGEPSVEMMRGPMLQALLEERFQLKVHRETREVPTYSLTVAKGGRKLEAYDEANCVPRPMPPPVNFISASRGQKPYCDLTWFERHGQNEVLYSSGRNLDSFARLLGTIMDRPVFDKTGIDGRYVFHLEFLPDENIRGRLLPLSPEIDLKASEPGPSIFTAVQTLGLRLESSKGPRDFIVIDRVEKPSEN